VARWATGQQAEALATFQRARTALAEEVGIDPGPALRQLEARILAQDATLRWTAPAAPAPAPAVAPAPVVDAHGPVADPFVGRVAERARLVAAVDRLRSGRGGIVLVAGGAGAGKTRLVQEALSGLGQGVAVGWGRASEVRAAPPHGPWREALGPAATVFDGEAGTDHGGETGAAQARLHAAVLAELARLAAERPPVLVLDDVHWADGSSLDLLAAAAEVGAELPALVVATFRDEEAVAGSPLARALGALARGRAVERITLAGLDADDVGRLTAALVGHDVSPADTAALAARTGGNPFFVTELARSGDDPDTGVPTSIRDVVRGRLARLPDSTRAVLEVAAVAGHGFSVDVVGGAVGLDVDDALDALDAALAADVVRAEPDGGLRFSHALIAEAVAEDLTAIRRARLHARVAAALQERPPGTVDPAAIAHHLFAGALAGTAEAAVEASAAAARAAARRMGHSEAAALWSQALAAVEVAAPTDRARRARLLVERGRAAARAGDVAGQLDALHEAMGLAEELGDDDLLIEAATTFGAATAWRWRDLSTTDVRTVAALERSLARLGPEPTPVRARVLSHLAVELDEVTQVDRKEELSEEAVAIARAVGDPEGLVRTLRHAILARFTPQAAESRVALAGELVAVADASGDEESATVARFSQMFSLLELARVGEADALLDRVVADVDRLRLVSLGFQVRWYCADRALLAGDLEAAAAHAEAAHRVHLQSGQFGADESLALHHLIRARLGAPGSDEAPSRHPSAQAAALLALARGASAAEARRVAWGDGRPEAVVEQHTDMFLVFARCLEVALDHAVAETGRAEAHYRTLLPFSGRLATGGTGAMCEGAVDHFLGLAADLRGDQEAAERHMRAALALHESIPAPLHVARTRSALSALGVDPA